MKVLVINPGSTSTKIAVFCSDGLLMASTIQHPFDEISAFKKVMDQFDYRMNAIEKELEINCGNIRELCAVVGRGGLLRPVSSGTYRINDSMLCDLSNANLWGREHASNLGAFIAKHIGDRLGIPSFITDPITVDEMTDCARISGVPDIRRKSVFHALNVRACARRASYELGKDMDTCSFVIIHIGGGISIVAFKQGKCIDVNNALLGMGPFSVNRVGALPTGDLIELAYSGKYAKTELLSLLSKKSGVAAYTGSNNGFELSEMIINGNDKVKLIVEAMAYQIVKEAGGMAAALEGNLDAVIISGGLARMEECLMPFIRKHLAYLGRCIVYPGEEEMKAMGEAGIRVLRNEEEAKEYGRA